MSKKTLRDLVGAKEVRSFTELVDNKLLGIEDYGYELQGTSNPLPDYDIDLHGDRSDYYGETQRVTVSEFIRQAQPQWEHVAYTEKRSSTRGFSGAPVVTMTDGRPAEEQLDEFNRQVLGLEDPSTYINTRNSKTVEYVDVDDE